MNQWKILLMSALLDFLLPLKTSIQHVNSHYSLGTVKKHLVQKIHENSQPARLITQKLMDYRFKIIWVTSCNMTQLYDYFLYPLSRGVFVYRHLGYKIQNRFVGKSRLEWISGGHLDPSSTQASQVAQGLVQLNFGSLWKSFDPFSSPSIFRGISEALKPNLRKFEKLKVFKKNGVFSLLVK